MKKKAVRAIFLFFIAIHSAFAAHHTQSKQLKDVAPFPAATKSTNRNVIWLQAQQNEALYKVEIIATKSGSKNCNLSSYTGHLSENTLKGWGYSYYKLSDINGPLTTRMACTGAATTALLPIQFDTESLIRYNSKLPIVIYTPKDVVISYKIWEAPPSAQPAEISNK